MRLCFFSNLKFYAFVRVALGGWEYKNEPKLAKERKLYPDKPNSAKTYYYSTNVWLILDKYFTKK